MQNVLVIRHTIQLHRYIFLIMHIQSAKKCMITKPIVYNIYNILKIYYI